MAYLTNVVSAAYSGRILMIEGLFLKSISVNWASLDLFTGDWGSFVHNRSNILVEKGGKQKNSISPPVVDTLTTLK